MTTDEPMRVLVLGATGMLGHEAVRAFEDDFEVHATARDIDRARTLGIEARLLSLDALHPERVPALLAEVRPDAVVNCIGIVKQLQEAKRPIPSIRINTLFPHELAEACAAAGVRLVHVSTDCVFSGTLPEPEAYTEEHRPDATDLYGRSKLLGEVTEGGALTLRTSIVGWEVERRSGLLEWFAAQGGQSVDGFRHAIFSGVTTRRLAYVIAAVLRDFPDLRGLYHVSAAPISKLDLLLLLREALHLDCEIRPVDEPRINRALDSSRFRAATGIDLPDWETMISEYVRERHGSHA